MSQLIGNISCSPDARNQVKHFKNVLPHLILSNIMIPILWINRFRDFNLSKITQLASKLWNWDLNQVWLITMFKLFVSNLFCFLCKSMEGWISMLRDLWAVWPCSSVTWKIGSDWRCRLSPNHEVPACRVFSSSLTLVTHFLKCFY